MFQSVGLLRYLIRTNDEGVWNMQIIRIGELPSEPGWFRLEFHRKPGLAQACGQANYRSQRGIG